MNQKMQYQPRAHAARDDVLERVNVLDVAALLGLKTQRRGKRVILECPFHQKNLGQPDRHLGNCVTLSDNNYATCRCWSCNGHGDVIAMTMDYLGLNYSDAIDYIAENLAPDLLKLPDQRSKKKFIKKNFPYSYKELELVGIKNKVNCRNAVNVCGNSRETSDLHFNEYIDFHSNDGLTFTVYQKETISVESFYQKNKEMFIEMVYEKANEKRDKLCRALYSTRKVLDKGQLRLGIERTIQDEIFAIDAIISKTEELMCA